VPDWDSTESRESDEDAAWRDLVARFDAPLAAEHPVPWPTREDIPDEAQRTSDTDGADRAGGAGAGGGNHRAVEAGGLDGEYERYVADGEHEQYGAGGERGRHAGDGEPGRSTAGGDRGADERNGDRSTDDLKEDRGAHERNGDRGADERNGKPAAAGSGDEPGGAGDRPTGRHGRRGPGGLNDPEVIQVPRTIRGPVRDDDEHYIPPAPPPLPKLDPVAKGAWAALFGGPGYLVIATAAGWSVSGLTAFCAVAAFIAGFAILVLRMHDPGPGGPDDGDTGAVV
jgi:hypothetical protein